MGALRTYVRFLIKEDSIKGGLADNMSIDDIAKLHSVNSSDIESQLKKGIKVELEHVNDEKIAEEIAMDHLVEDPKYYDKLKTIENE